MKEILFHVPLLFFVLLRLSSVRLQNLSFPQSRKLSGVGNLSGNNERFRTSLPASGGAIGDRGRNDKIAGIVALLTSLLVLIVPSLASATTEYARQTGFECRECHIQAIGGGPLTKAGKEFLAEMKIKGLYRPLTSLQKIIRFIVGYIHLLTAVAWFGTILYVHILLKPAYAAKGLPRGELILGWMSIIIMAVTGTLLSLARIPSWEVFYTTRFGVLLSIKIILFLIMASTAVVVTFFVGPKLRERMKEQRERLAGEDRKHFGIGELHAFDGKEGRRAYIAYKGSVYDVTGSKLWKDGSHLKKHSAGNDLTELLKTAPHGEEKVIAMRRVGELKEEGEKLITPLHERIFYFFAYMNLVFVFLIIFVIALMRWG